MYVEGFIVDWVIDEDVLFFVDCQEMSTVAVFDQFAVGYLDVL